MGGFFGAVSRESVISDVFFGTDYHSHLGTKSAGMAAFDSEIGLQRSIHRIANSPFRTKFERVFEEMQGTAGIGCINDTDPQPLLIRSRMGTFAICFVGNIINYDELINRYLLESGGHFDAMTAGRVNTTELLAAIIAQRESFVQGLRLVQEEVEGTASILILTQEGHLIAARDKLGRLPIVIGRSESGHCVSFESFAGEKLGYAYERELGPGEIVEITADSVKVLKEPGREMRICAFLWSYYGYSTSGYEGVNVECMRCRNGVTLAQNDAKSGNMPAIDYVAGVPDSGTPHAIGYANESKIPFARPFIKYTPTWPRSFMSASQVDRNKVAKMKMIPVGELIHGKKLLFVDDSIVRGTQMRETVDFLYENGAAAVHMRSACPPIMFGCKYLNFSRATSDMELICRATIAELEGDEGINHIEEYCDSSTERGQKMREVLCKKLHLASLEFQTLEGLCKSIGVDSCKLCTYCWNGKE